jgi:hypothetical protein
LNHNKSRVDRACWLRRPRAFTNAINLERQEK